MNVAIIGCGLIGRKRALALSPIDKLVACCDTNIETAEKFGLDFNCYSYIDYNKLLSEVKSDIVIVAVVNKYSLPIIIDALNTGSHILVEKPLGRNYVEAKQIFAEYQKAASFSFASENRKSNNLNIPSLHYSNTPLLKTGFNHRFHPAVLKSKEIVDAKEIGEIINIRARYGHGGRPGMEKEWRASKELCGGGELLDQGVHVIDLIRWFGGDIVEVFGSVETKFWNMEVEDNAYSILKTKQNVTASFHVSWTNWKNIFSFEVFGTDGYLRIDGLGGSYGKETLEIGKRKMEGDVPDIQIIEYPLIDVSWVNEWKEFSSAIKEKREVIGSGYDGLKANEVITAIYKSNQQKEVIFLD